MTILNTITEQTFASQEMLSVPFFDFETSVFDECGGGGVLVLLASHPFPSRAICEWCKKFSVFVSFSLEFELFLSAIRFIVIL